MTRRVEQLGEHDVRRFRSGVHSLDDYLRRHARGNTEAGLGTTWLVLRGGDDPADWPEIIGYFTLSMADLPAEVTRRLTGEKVPGYNTPVVLIGRLARDQRVRGGGVGGTLIGEALRISLVASGLVSCFGAITDAKEETALQFYKKYGFRPIDDDEAFPRRCFLALKTARQAI